MPRQPDTPSLAKEASPEPGLPRPSSWGPQALHCCFWGVERCKERQEQATAILRVTKPYLVPPVPIHTAGECVLRLTARLFNPSTNTDQHL